MYLLGFSLCESGLRASRSFAEASQPKQAERRQPPPGGDPVEQEKRVKYRDLVANAVMLRNVADLTDVLADLKADGHDFTRDQVTRLSPYMTTHLKRFGQYVLDMDGQPPPLEPKSLDLVDEASPLC